MTLLKNSKIFKEVMLTGSVAIDQVIDRFKVSCAAVLSSIILASASLAYYNRDVAVNFVSSLNGHAKTAEPAEEDCIFLVEDPKVIIVDLEKKVLRFYENKELKKEYPVRVGKAKTPTPTGDGYISEKRDPGFFENLVGPNKGKIKRYAELTNGQSVKIPYENMRSLAFKIIGNDDERLSIHSHYDEDTIGRAASNGCVGMKIKDMLDLYPLIEPGTMIIIGL